MLKLWSSQHFIVSFLKKWCWLNCFFLFLVYNGKCWSSFLNFTKPYTIGKVDNESWKLTEQPNVIYLKWILNYEEKEINNFCISIVQYFIFCPIKFGHYHCRHHHWIYYHHCHLVLISEKEGGAHHGRILHCGEDCTRNILKSLEGRKN